MPIFDPHCFDPTAFMSGQILSKMWLCQELEGILYDRFPQSTTIWLLGGWYATTSLLLQSRKNVNIRKIISFDQDPDAIKGSLILNESFQHLGRFEAHLADVTTLDYDAYGQRPEVVINTSVEHMPDKSWFDRIPNGTLVVLQSNDMPHDDHVFNHISAHELSEEFPMRQKIFTGELPFDYGEWGFRRFMTIGVK